MSQMLINVIMLYGIISFLYGVSLAMTHKSVNIDADSSHCLNKNEILIKVLFYPIFILIWLFVTVPKYIYKHLVSEIRG